MNQHIVTSLFCSEVTLISYVPFSEKLFIYCNNQNMELFLAVSVLPLEKREDLCLDPDLSGQMLISLAQTLSP